jgi:hypothetical protein
VSEKWNPGLCRYDVVDSTPSVPQAAKPEIGSTQHKEWVSVEEPPNHRDKVIVWFTGGSEDDSPVRFGRYVHSLGEWRLEGSNSKWNDRITHWRELPAPPDTSKGQG